MKEILSIINLKEQENSFLKMVNIMKANTKMVQKMEKEYFIMQTALKNMMVFMRMINMKEKVKNIMKMENSNMKESLLVVNMKEQEK